MKFTIEIEIDEQQIQSLIEAFAEYEMNCTAESILKAAENFIRNQVDNIALNLDEQIPAIIKGDWQNNYLEKIHELMDEYDRQLDEADYICNRGIATQF